MFTKYTYIVRAIYCANEWVAEGHDKAQVGFAWHARDPGLIPGHRKR